MDDQTKMVPDEGLGRVASRIVVVGGGLAGLTAAVRAAQKGMAVTLLEGAQKVGGRAQTDVKDGFHFNMGPHALYIDGGAYRSLQALGISVKGGMPALKGTTVLHKGRKHLLPVDLSTVWRSQLFSLADKWEVTRFFQKLPNIEAHHFDEMTLEWTMRFLVRRERVRDYLLMMARLATYANAPGVLSGGTVIRQMQGTGQGVMYLDGGWQQIVDLLREKAMSLGVAIHQGKKVDVIQRAKGGYRVVTKNGELFEASAVVLAVAPKVAARIAGDIVKEVRGYESEAVPVRAACLDVALDHVPNAIQSFALGIDDDSYFSVHSGVAKMAPEGGGLVHAALYLQQGDVRTKDQLEAKLKQVMSAMQPGWEKHVKHMLVRPNMLVSNWLPTARQAGLKGRPSVALSRLGLYLAGDWVGEEGLLADAALLSAMKAADMAAAHCGQLTVSGVEAADHQ